jgi:hypothetical protein
VLVIMAFMVVIMLVGVGAFVCGFSGPLGCVRLGGSFECVGRAQRFAFQAHGAERTAGPGHELPDRLANSHCGLQSAIFFRFMPPAADSGPQAAKNWSKPLR